MDRTLAVLGREDAIRCWRESIANLIERPLLRNFVGGVMRLFGGKPGAVIRMIPKGWSQGYRDFCNPRFQRLGDNLAELHFENIAPQTFESEGYLYCWYGISMGIFDLEKPSNGRVDFDIDRPGSRAVARFSWD
jgi:hypothetical protein